MARVTLAGTDLNVSRICIGCWQMNSGKPSVNWEPQSLETSKACVDKSFELGINFFDTAESYPGSEEVLGKCLQGRRKDAVIASKFGFRDGPSTPAYSPQEIDAAVTNSLRKLQTDYIDLLQVHWPTAIRNMDETVTELKRQVALGRLRYLGVCNFGPKNLESILATGVTPVTNQMCYNLLWRSIEDEVIPICRENNTTVLAYSPLQQGLLTGNYMTPDSIPEGRRRGKLFAPESTKLSRHGTPGAEKEVFESLRAIKDSCAKANVPMAKAALSWILQQPGNPVAIVGCRTPEQVVDNSQVVKLSDDVMKQLTDATEPVKAKVGKALDQYNVPDRCE